MERDLVLNVGKSSTDQIMETLIPVWEIFQAWIMRVVAMVYRGNHMFGLRMVLSLKGLK